MIHFNRIALALGFTLSFLVSLAMADLAGITCNATSHCPSLKPCCLQYGVCGLGGLCLGGCDVRYSYNLTLCMPMPIMLSFDTTFDSLDPVLLQDNYFGNLLKTDWLYTGAVALHLDALLMQMPANSGGTVISSSKYLLYGNVKATLKASHGVGVITAFIMFSDVQDEIDWEYVGYNLSQVQTNYYSLGVLNWTNLANHSMDNVFENWHTYELDWKPDATKWLVDGQVVRVLNRNETYNSTLKRYEYPATPSRIQMSLWPGGASTNAVGTVAWAGGAIDWNLQDIQQYGYYYAYLKNVLVTAYDLPLTLAKVTDSRYSLKDFNAFLYNLTDGFTEDIFLLNRATWLSGNDADGNNPGNFNGTSPDHELTTVITLNGQVLTVVRTNTLNQATGTAHGGPDQGQGTASAYDDSNGFVQNANQVSLDLTKTGNSNSSKNNVSWAIWMLISGAMLLL